VTRAAAAGLAAALAAVALAACGGGGGKKSTVSTPSTTTTQSTGTTPTTATPQAHAPETPTAPTTPKQTPGGAGGETPAHFDAVFTGRGGSISPREVSVGPYISARVILKSGDGQRYSLEVNGKTLQAGGAPLTLPGLKPGQSYTLKQPGGGPAVKITANAEPGP
jgi:hypothetical protein